MEYITTKEASKKWGISTIRITVLANEGRIPGAYRLGKSWLIPATATKPEARKPSRKSAHKGEPDSFSFPLCYLRPDWSIEKVSQLSTQHRILFKAETAVLECRFEDAYRLLESIRKSPDDIVMEIGCLGLIGICCIALNYPKDFSKIYQRLHMLLSDDFPYRDDLIIILDFLRTYVETLDYSAQYGYTYNPDIQAQCAPLACVLMGFTGYAKESLNPGSADIPYLELILRLLQTTGAVIATEFMNCHLLAIYDMRQDTERAKDHAKAVIQIAYENKFYLPLATYYPYYKQVFDPFLSEYPEDFRTLLQKIATQHEEDFSAFLSSINEYNAFAILSREDYPYTHGVYMGLSNADIAKKLGVSIHTVSRRLDKIYEKLGVKNKKELQEYLHKNM